MSVDFYAAVDRWPTQVQMEKCMVERSYPIRFERFPAPVAGGIAHDGIVAVVDGEQAYLEGDIFPDAGSLSAEDKTSRSEIADMFGANSQQYLLTVHFGSRPAEFIATAYVLSGLIKCFGGSAYDPQGNTRGQAEFADALLASVPLLKAMSNNAPNR